MGTIFPAESPALKPVASESIDKAIASIKASLDDKVFELSKSAVASSSIIFIKKEMSAT